MITFLPVDNEQPWARQRKVTPLLPTPPQFPNIITSNPLLTPPVEASELSERDFRVQEQIQILGWNDWELVQRSGRRVSGTTDGNIPDLWQHFWPQNEKFISVIKTENRKIKSESKISHKQMPDGFGFSEITIIKKNTKHFCIC